MTAEIVFLPGCCCEICAQAVGDRILEGLLVCEACAAEFSLGGARIVATQESGRVRDQLIALPVPPGALKEHRGPSLDEIVDTLLRGAQ